jgi:opacity protein-like surface antigen
VVIVLASAVLPARAADWDAGLQLHRVSPLNTSNSDRIEAGSEDRWAVSGVLGLAPTTWLRLEAELGWRRSELHGFNRPPRIDSADGNVQLWYGMANAWLGVPERLLPWAQPYAGGGIGGGYQVIDGVSASAIAKTDLDDRAAKLGWQLGGGVRVPVATSLVVDLGARWFDIGDVEQLGVMLGLAYRW